MPGTDVEKQAGRRPPEMYTSTLCMVDAAVTGALIAGLSPVVLKAALTYRFLHSAARSRDASKKELKLWTSNLSLVWDPMLNSVIDFVEAFKGKLADEGDTDELVELRRIRGLIKPESDLRRQEQQALDLMQWIMRSADAQDALSSRMIEMCFLVTWFKVAAVNGDAPDRAYITVKQQIMAVFEAYNQVVIESQVITAGNIAE